MLLLLAGWLGIHDYREYVPIPQMGPYMFYENIKAREFMLYVYKKSCTKM